MKKMIFSFALALSFSATAEIYDPTQFRLVPDDKVIEQLTSSGKMMVPENLSILVWNIKKGTGAGAWRKDFHNLIQGKSIAVLQEMLQNESVPQTLNEVPSFGWTMAKTYYMEINKNATGVVTGAVQDPETSLFLRSPDTEPVINTYKITLLTSYGLSNGQKLMVGNIHAINFQKPEPFYRQVDALMAQLAKWKGPIFLAGDFNTWIPVRLQYLQDRAKAIGLEQVVFSGDPRPAHKQLDHIFVRGCQFSNAKILSNMKSSDHAPLTIDLACGR